MNSDLYADIQCRKECEGYYGFDRWYAGHRNGETGLNNPWTADIQLYKNAAGWTHSQIQNGHSQDDWRFWVDVVVSAERMNGRIKLLTRGVANLN